MFARRSVAGSSSGSSAARLARVVRDDEVGGSNPLSPTWVFALLGRRPSMAGQPAGGHGRRDCPRSSVVERILGKNEVGGSIPPVGSIGPGRQAAGPDAVPGPAAVSTARSQPAEVAELADARDSNSRGVTPVWVQIPPSVLLAFANLASEHPPTRYERRSHV